MTRAQVSVTHCTAGRRLNVTGAGGVWEWGYQGWLPARGSLLGGSGRVGGSYPSGERDTESHPIRASLTNSGQRVRRTRRRLGQRRSRGWWPAGPTGTGRVSPERRSDRAGAWPVCAAGRPVLPVQSQGEGGLHGAVPLPWAWTSGRGGGNAAGDHSLGGPRGPGARRPAACGPRWARGP